MASGISSSESEVREEMLSSPNQAEIIISSSEANDQLYRVSELRKSARARIVNMEEEARHNKHWSICRVPSRLREHNKDAYTPRIVSIGPFHHGEEKLHEMEVFKTRYMHSLFERGKVYSEIFDEVVEAIVSMEEEARSCYNDISNSNDRTKTSLVEILLVDGCFLLELFLRWKSLEIRPGDPIFGAGTISSLHRDLTLLENQIPFFVLQKLFHLMKIVTSHEDCSSAKPLTLDQLCASFFYLKSDSSQSSSSDCKHLLDLIRNSYVPNNTQVSSNPYYEIYFPMYFWDDWYSLEDSDPNWKKRREQSYELINCVTKLRESGIKFKLKESGLKFEKATSENLFDIKFRKGELEMPKLRIDDTMDSLLRNMIAFEQCCHGTSYHITSFAILMDCLIDSPADTEYLQQKRIIENYLGHGEEVSNIFNKISKKVFVEDFYFAALCKQVNDYCEKPWPKKREIFVRDYWYSPWKFIGIVAGSILLLLAVLQTGYTMLAYHDPPK